MLILTYKQVYDACKKQAKCNTNSLNNEALLLAMKNIMMKNNTDLALRSSQSGTTKVIHIRSLTD